MPYSPASGGVPGSLSGGTGVNTSSVGGAVIAIHQTSSIIPRKAPAMPKPKWHAPWKLYRVISGHLGWVRCVTVEPGNEWFATGSADRVIKVIFLLLDFTVLIVNIVLLHFKVIFIFRYGN